MKILFIICSALIIGFIIGCIKTANTYITVAKADSLKRLLPVIIAEKTDDTYYLYDKDTSAFLCQGNSKSEVAESLKRFFLLAMVAFEDNHGIDVQLFINGKFKQLAIQ